MPAGVQKTVFEGPVLSQIVPAVVLLLPAVMTQLAYQGGGKSFRIERRDPEPFMFGGFGREFAPAVVILRKRLFGSHDPYGLGIIDGEGQAFGIPELYLITLAAAPLSQLAIGGPVREQPDSGLIPFAMILFQADDQVPAEFLSQFKNRRLSVKSVQQKDIEKAAAVLVGEFAEQTQSGGVLTLARLEPFQGEKGLDGAVANLTSPCAVVVLNLFDFNPGFADCDAPFQTSVAMTAVAGKHFDTVQRWNERADPRRDAISSQWIRTRSARGDRP